MLLRDSPKADMRGSRKESVLFMVLGTAADGWSAGALP
jgi:hypothetical protein